MLIVFETIQFCGISGIIVRGKIKRTGDKQLSDDHDHWHHMVSLGHNGLMTPKAADDKAGNFNAQNSN